MSRDWLVLAPLALGHVGLFVLAVNVTHALGLHERWMDRVKLALLGFLVGGAALLSWEAWARPWSSWSWLAQGYALACLATALVGLPLASLIRSFRANPGGITGHATTVDLAETGGTEFLIGPGRHSWMLRLPGNESLTLRKVECELAVPRLSPALEGFSILHLSDLHFAPCFQRGFFEAVVDQVAGWKADVVVFTGDLVDHDDALKWVVPVLSRLSARYGSYAILGNHDLLHEPPLIRREIERAGFTDLDGRWTRLEVGGGTVAIGGTSYPWGPRLDARAMPEADYRILLSHTPDRFGWAQRAGIDLMLAGHNHGGQIRFPILGPVFMPSLYSRRFDRGFFQSGRTLMYVSQGVAGKHPVRYGCVPEVSRLVLTPAGRLTPHATPRHSHHGDSLTSSGRWS